MESETIPGTVVMVGIGQMASVLSFGLLRIGHTVVPVIRDCPLSRSAARVPAPELVMLAVGEDELDPLLAEMPAPWRARVGLLQNELRPSVWKRHGIQGPTLLSAWFEKKRGIDVRVLRPSRVFGPAASLLVRALGAIGVPAELAPESELSAELARKNLYILTANISGLAVDESVGVLWEQHRDLVEGLFDELLTLEGRRLEVELDRAAQYASWVAGVMSAPDRRARGRTAPDRLRRALSDADRMGLALPRLREIASHI